MGELTPEEFMAALDRQASREMGPKPLRSHTERTRPTEDERLEYKRRLIRFWRELADSMAAQAVDLHVQANKMEEELDAAD